MKNTRFTTLLLMFFIFCDMVYITSYNIPKGHWFEEYSHQVCGEVFKDTSDTYLSIGKYPTSKTEYWLSIQTESGIIPVEVSRETYLIYGEGSYLCQKVYKPINFIIKFGIIFQFIFFIMFIIWFLYASFFN